MALGNIVLFMFLLNLAAGAPRPPCNALNDPDVKFFDLTLPVTDIPAQLTTYMCQTFNIPLLADGSYHAVAFEPIIANPDVMHHMILFGCQERASSVMSHECTPADFKCRTILVQWSMGLDGPICSPPNTGVRFGHHSLQSMALQIHWNNANGSSGIQDSSGIRVYYTKKMKRYDVGNVQVGQNDLEIPAHSRHHEEKGSCSSDCTSQWLKEPIYLARGHIHMHYLGSGGVLEVLRDGQVVSEVLRDDAFDYNKPSAHELTTPVQVRPGDELRLTCFFNSRDGTQSRNRTFYWGEGSDGEMCYAFITYYPKVQNFDQCIQFDHYDICTRPDETPSLGECIFGGFVHAYESGLAEDILQKCEASTIDQVMANPNRNPTSVDLRSGQHGGHGSLCSTSCDLAIKELTEHPCMQDRLGLEAMRVYLSPIPSWTQVKSVLDRAALYCNN